MKRLALLLLLLPLIFVAAKCKKDPPPEPPPVDTTLVCNLNIPGGCLDEWFAAGQEGYSWNEPKGGFLETLNELSALPPEAGGPGPVTTIQTPESYAGPYAAKLVSTIFSPQVGTNILLPGLLGATKLDIPNQTIHLGKPYTQKPVAIHGYYRYAPVNGDSAMILVILHKFNATLAKRDTIAYMRQIYTSTVNTYTEFNLPLVYYDNTATPDSITLVMIASAALNLQSLTDCQGQAGSTMYIDEISFIMP